MLRERLEGQARLVWKSFLNALPVICFYLFLFCTVLLLFGTQYIMVVSLVTVLFQTNYRKRRSGGVLPGRRQASWASVCWPGSPPGPFRCLQGST